MQGIRLNYFNKWIKIFLGGCHEYQISSAISAFFGFVYVYFPYSVSTSIVCIFCHGDNVSYFERVNIHGERAVIPYRRLNGAVMGWWGTLRRLWRHAACLRCWCRRLFDGVKKNGENSATVWSRSPSNKGRRPGIECPREILKAQVSCLAAWDHPYQDGCENACRSGMRETLKTIIFCAMLDWIYLND